MHLEWSRGKRKGERGGIKTSTQTPTAEPSNSLKPHSFPPLQRTMRQQKRGVMKDMRLQCCIRIVSRLLARRIVFVITSYNKVHIRYRTHIRMPVAVLPRRQKTQNDVASTISLRPSKQDQTPTNIPCAFPSLCNKKTITQESH